MGRKNWAVATLVGLMVLSCQIHCHEARKLGPFRQYTSSLVLHFQPHLHNFIVTTASYGVESNSADVEKADVTEDNDEDGADKNQEEESEGMKEPHPADELLQTLKADGTKSYILGGY